MALLTTRTMKLNFYATDLPNIIFKNVVFWFICIVLNCGIIFQLFGIQQSVLRRTDNINCQTRKNLVFIILARKYVAVRTVTSTDECRVYVSKN